MVGGIVTLLSAPLLLLAQLPSSTNFKLNSYGVGSGGSSGMDSTNYSLEGITGEAGSSALTGSSYNIGGGFISTEQANVPPAPILVNSSNWYNKLHFTLDTGSNPSDARFAVAISTDDFVTTNYIQNDNTIGASLGLEDYQTYAQWGGGSGEDVIGLVADTAYKIKVKSEQGKFTETAYGPTATASTVSPTLTFDIDVSSTDSDTNPPFTVSFGSLLADTVADAPEKIWLDFETNGASGGNIYVYGQQAGLRSTSQSYTIASATGNLSSLNEGFGVRSNSAGQSAGGPIAPVSPYDGASHNVGVTDTSIRQAYSASAPITGGRTSFLVKAKAQGSTPAASDYAETITVLAAASF